MSTALFGLELPELSTDSPPRFVDIASCRDWVGGIVTKQVHQTQALLLRQLNLLNRYALPAAERYAMLELLRDAVHTANEDGALRFTARPLPLTPPEQAAFDTCQALWQALEIGYLHCLQKFTGAATAADKNDARQIAQATARALTCLSASYIDACRAAILPPPGFWARLHRLHQVLEPLQLTQSGIDDPQRAQFASTVTATSLYVEPLLLAAAHPLELDPQQLSQVIHWARLWGHKVKLLAAPPADLRTPPLGIEIAGDAAAIFKTSPAASDTLRWLDMAGLRLAIKQIFAALEKGDTGDMTELLPLSLRSDQDTPDPLTSSSRLALLRQVYQDWCRGGRRSSSKKTTGNCRLIPGIEAVHQFLAGTEADAQDAAGAGTAATVSVSAENWQKTHEHVAHVRLQRPLSQPGKRLARAQLVAVCMNEGDNRDSFLIGKLQWVAISGTRDALLACMHILPGQPEAIRIRFHAEGIQATHAQDRPGFLLPAIPRLDEPASILIPPRCFNPGQRACIDTTAGSRKIYLRECLDNGVDFVRCTFIDA